MMRSIAAALIALVPWSPCLAGETLVDLELALAVDASASVDEDEFRLQLQGIAMAFRDPAVIKAVGSGPTHRVAVNLVVWAEALVPKDMSGWFIIATPEEARRFSDVVAAYPRRLSGGTGIGDGIAEAMRSFDRNGIASPRQVVDVSGDGRETAPRDFAVIMPVARSMAVARGITINGLAIRNEVPDLDQWYRDHVQIGPGSFVMSAATYRDFAAAMRLKLLRELDFKPHLSLRSSNAFP
jgi:hypothetical protein